jgi:insecticidal toxin complex protein TccC
MAGNRCCWMRSTTPPTRSSSNWPAILCSVTWTYDPADGRLHTQSSRKDGAVSCREFEYFYDPSATSPASKTTPFSRVYFANQLIDGHRDFAYDSLYRLTSATGHDDAPPSDIPGLPQPGDPNNRLNYTQTYTVRQRRQPDRTVCTCVPETTRTRQMRIDPKSAIVDVRWKPGDPEPDFDKLFDHHGNQQAPYNRDRPLRWNCPGRTGTRDSADSRENGTMMTPNATVTARACACSNATTILRRQHRTFPSGALPAGPGNPHARQWRRTARHHGRQCALPALGKKQARCRIENDQLRYSLEDHLGSCVMELDQQGRLISEEGYYPFGATAWMAAQHGVEVQLQIHPLFRQGDGCQWVVLLRRTLLRAMVTTLVQRRPEWRL